MAFMKLVRADGETEVDVEFNYTAGSPAIMYGDNSHPGDDPEVEITAATDPSGNPVKWTDDEDEKWVQSIFEDYDPSDDYGDTQEWERDFD